MAVENPLRDASNAIFTALGYRVNSNWVDSHRRRRNISLERPCPKLDGTKALNAWKRDRIAELTAAGMVFYSEERGTVRKGVFCLGGVLPNERVPGYKETEKVKAPSVHVLPPSVATYITQELGRKLEEVIAHRHVSGEEPKYAVLMGGKFGMWTVIFIGSYKARRPLGPYEEPTQGTAELVEWVCVSDADDWEHSVEKFKNAPSNFFPPFG